ncbi:MAG: hypothetical protein LAP21_09465 [Acidobacteriia bacterium]|nr:hypothetical protein [Terriglobia bacterium]
MAFLDEVFQPFYTAAPTHLADYAFGQIFRAPAYYPHQRLDIWRPKIIDTRLGIASDFNITTAGADAFQRALPFSSPPLKTNEEFIALKSKPRPVILIQPPDPALVSVKRTGYAGKVVRHLCPVALVYSAEDDAGNSKFDTEFLERIRKLEYRQFLFLPKGGPITVDSIARLDEVQSVAVNQLAPSQFALSKEVTDIVRSQVSYFFTGLSGREFGEWATLLRD